MGAIDIIQGILIYMYAHDHNPPHIHIRYAGIRFSITIKGREVEGKSIPRLIRIVNEYIDEHEKQLLELWEKAQRGERINKIK